MAKIIIIGNSAAGFSACQALINGSPVQEITVISEEECPAYKKNLLLGYLSGNIQESELFLSGADFYQKNNINFLSGREACRIETRKQRVILKDNSRLDYDYLIIASGRKIKLPDIPGKNKEGVLTFYTLKDAKQVMEKLMISQTVCIIGNTQVCLELAGIIAAKGKEVKIISQSGFREVIPGEKIELISGLSLAEFIGEGELQALKLTSGKVIGTALAILTDNYLPSSDFLKDTDIKTDSGYVIVDNNMRTNLENVFACGSVASREPASMDNKSWEEAFREGELAAENLISRVNSQTLDIS